MEVGDHGMKNCSLPTVCYRQGSDCGCDRDLREGEGGRQLEEGRPREGRERTERRKRRRKREERHKREGLSQLANTAVISTMEIQKWIHTICT